MHNYVGVVVSLAHTLNVCVCLYAGPNPGDGDEWVASTGDDKTLRLWNVHQDGGAASGNSLPIHFVFFVNSRAMMGVHRTPYTSVGSVHPSVTSRVP